METTDLMVLTNCIGTRNHGGQREFLRGISNEQWQSVISLAQKQRVSPILFHKLKEMKIHLASELEEKLRKETLWNYARNIRLFKDLDIVLQRMNDEKIPTIVLKGVFLAETVYRNPGLRPLNDIDLLIKTADLERAIELLKTLGYIPERPFWAKVDFDYHFHAPIMSKGETHIELHWNLTQTPKIPNEYIENMWTRAEGFIFQKTPTQSLNICDLILHIIIHCAYGHYYFFQFLSLVDLYEVLTGFWNEIDWNFLLNLSRNWKVERGVYLTLRLVDNLFGFSEISDKIKALEPEDWADEILERALYRVTNGNTAIGENYARLILGNNIPDKVAALIRGFFPSRKVLAMEFGINPISKNLYRKYPQYIASKLPKYWKLLKLRLKGDAQQVRDIETDRSLHSWLGHPS